MDNNKDKEKQDNLDELDEEIEKEESLQEEEEEEGEEEEEEEQVDDEPINLDLEGDEDDNILVNKVDEAVLNIQTHQTQQVQFADDEPVNYDHIKDPNVRMLMSVKIEESSKDDVVNLLMGNKALNKKSVDKGNKGKKNYRVESKYKMENLQNDSNYKTNFHINPEKEDPEFTADFDSAVKKLYTQMKNDPQNKDLIKLLIPDKEKMNQDSEPVNRDQIDTKVKTFLAKKQKNLEKIDEKINEDFMQKHTFNPELINDRRTSRRNMEQFLNDQDNHSKKIQEKIQIAKDENLKKEIQVISESHPKIDENSAKIFQDKIKTDDPTHIRLYKQRFEKPKKDVMNEKEKEKLNSTKKNLKKGIKKIDDVLQKKEKVKRPAKKEGEDHLLNLYKSHEQQKQRLENLKKKVIQEEEKGKGLNTAGQYSNKVFLKNVMERYRKVVNEVFIGIVSPSQSSSNQSESILQNVNLTKFNLIQLSEVLHKFGFTEFVMKESENKEEKEIKEENLSEVKNEMTQTNIPEKLSVSKENEKHLICEIWDVLKDSEGNVNVDHLFIFILAVINLYDYYLFSSYKKTFKPELTSETENNTLIKTNGKVIQKKKTQSEDREETLAKIFTDINSKITQNTKYGGFDDNHNFLISNEKAKLINKDFSIFYINFMMKRYELTTKVDKSAKFATNNATHKPQINEKSNKLYNEYRRKVIELNESSENQESRVEKEKDILAYIDMLVLKKKKQQNEYLKIKEEIRNSELNGCTFKPKINDDYHNNKEGEELENRSGRWDKLYKMGIQIVNNRKDKDKGEFEIEKYGKECSFKPNINKQEINNNDNDKFQNDIYNEKSYELLYARLKNGRVQRMIKESVHERGEFPVENEELMNKSRTNTQPSPKNTSTYKNRAFKSNDLSQSQLSNSKRENTEEIIENFNNEPEKKDSIPLLIIDVNIRPGVKKKIYVFDGDTSEGLAEKFAKEHNLDTDTKAKLQVLIQSHMSRLLMSIAEENQSVSEKSSTYNH